MKNLSIALALSALMAVPMTSVAQAEGPYYLNTDCATVENTVKCTEDKLLSALVIGSFFGLMTGGVAFAGAGGVIAAGETAVILGTTVGLETALVGGAVIGGLTAVTLTSQ